MLENKIQKLVYLILSLSFIGFLDAGYLSIKSYLGQLPNCSLFNGCEKVVSSSYSRITGIPVSYIGFLFYTSLIVAAVSFILYRKIVFLRYFQVLSIIGFCFTLWLVFIQLFVIKAICVYCILSAIISGLLFIAAIILIKFRPQNQ